jgi:hypothetical protein
LDIAVDNDEIDALQPGSSSRIFGDEEVVPVSPLQSKKLPKEILLKYQHHEEKLRREVVAISLNDNLWHLKSWNANGMAIVKIHCSECVKDLEAPLATTAISQ